MTSSYHPIYGVEPYNALGSPASDDYGGGADLTQENLLATLFEITGTPADPTTFTYNRVKPANALSPAGVQFFGPGFDKQLRSRNACRVNIQVTAEDMPISKLYLALLNPPLELKQMALDPGSPAVLDPSVPGGGGIAFNSTQQNFFTFFDWDIRFLMVDLIAAWPPAPAAVLDNVFIGSPMPIGLPYRTCGDDGEDPIPYGPYTTANAVIEAANLIKNGAPFFIPVIFAFVPVSAEPETTSFVMHIAWPHSGASRG